MLFFSEVHSVEVTVTAICMLGNLNILQKPSLLVCLQFYLHLCLYVFVENHTSQFQFNP